MTDALTWYHQKKDVEAHQKINLCRAVSVVLGFIKNQHNEGRV